MKNMDGHCLTAWDGTGKIFAVGIPRKQIISLYSMDAFDKVCNMRFNVSSIADFESLDRNRLLG